MTNKTLTASVAASAVLGGFAALLLSFLWAAAWSGYTLSVLWEWFMVPAFGLPALSVAQAYGLALVVRVAKGIDTKTDKNPDSLGLVMGKSFVLAPLACGLFLLFGWVAKSFV